MNKLQAAEQLRKALQMFFQTLTDDQAMEVATVCPAWKTGVSYTVDFMVSYGKNEVGDPQLYRCVQAHTSQIDWTPDVAISLWTPIGLAPDNIPIWSQPTGAHDAYNTGDRVHYPDKDGAVYESEVDGNVWEPRVYGWSEVSD